MTNKKTVILGVAKEVRKSSLGESSGHDWWHSYRVWKMAKHIGQKEKADLFVVELAALLHDIADWKLHGGNETVGPRTARRILLKQRVPNDIIDHVCEIISTMSFKGAGVKTEMRTHEGKIVQDADRLDALGAIGIARTFAYGGHIGRSIHDPEQKPILHQSKKAYIKYRGTTINHFYEKLLLLKNRMNTVTAKKMAAERHKFMEKYVKRFLQEWNGKV